MPIRVHNFFCKPIRSSRIPLAFKQPKDVILEIESFKIPSMSNDIDTF